ncbi:MAG: hypothetical protein J5928_05005 [Firmicutes bacterium]|nr:hypothetical protein [Bacillota bacterium]
MKKILTLMMVVLLVALSVVPAFAADPTTPPNAGDDSQYKPVEGDDSTTFDKYLITNEGQKVPDLEFEYTIEPGKAVAASDDKFEIKAGIGAPTVSSAVFGEADPANHQKFGSIQTGDTLGDLPDGTVYSKDTVTVDFTGIKFTEPGVYRYIITEQEIPGSGVEYDIEAGNSMKRVLDVYVVDTEETTGTDVPKLAIQDYVLHETETVINLTPENGSKDENAVASKWSILGYEDDPAYQFDTKEEAEAKLEEMKSTSTTSDHYDQAIVDKQGEVDVAKAAWDGAIAAREGAEAAAGIPDKQQAVTDAQAAVDKLLEGENPAPAESIEDLLAADPYREGEKDLLKKYGRNALYDYLVRSTDAAVITKLRAIVVELDAALGAEDGTTDPSAYKTLRDAEKALKDAQDGVKTYQDAEDAAKAVYDAKVAELGELVAKHNAAVVVESAWKLKDKSDHYTNKVSTYDLEFGKEVTGNQGSRDKYFKFTLTLEGLTKPADEKWTYGGTDYESEELAKQAVDAATAAGETPDYTQIVHVPEVKASVVTIDATDSIFTREPSKTAATIYEADGTDGMKEANSRDDDDDDTNGQQLIADVNGKIEWTVYLKDGEYVSFKDLPSGISYTVTEVEEDYKKTDGTDKVVSGDKKHDDAASGTLDKSIYTGFTNTKNGIIPTGVIMSITGGIALIAIAGAGLFALNRRKDEDEE